MNDANRLLRNARREAGLVLLIWLAALLWTEGVSYWLGFGRAGEPVRTVFGIPEWVAVGVLLPWGLCTVATVVFCVRVMKDDDLGQEGAGNA